MHICTVFCVIINHYLILYACIYIYFVISHSHIALELFYSTFSPVRKCTYICSEQNKLFFLFFFFFFSEIFQSGFLLFTRVTFHAPKMRQVSLYSQARSEISDVSLLIFFPRKSEPSLPEAEAEGDDNSLPGESLRTRRKSRIGGKGGRREGRKRGHENNSNLWGVEPDQIPVCTIPLESTYTRLLPYICRSFTPSHNLPFLNFCCPRFRCPAGIRISHPNDSSRTSIYRASEYWKNYFCKTFLDNIHYLNLGIFFALLFSSFYFGLISLYTELYYYLFLTATIFNCSYILLNTEFFIRLTIWKFYLELDK